MNDITRIINEELLKNGLKRIVNDYKTSNF